MTKKGKNKTKIRSICDMKDSTRKFICQIKESAVFFQEKNTVPADVLCKRCHIEAGRQKVAGKAYLLATGESAL